MSEYNEYAVISVAYRSRFVWRTDAEFRRALGVSFETVVNKRDSERDMEMYYGILNRETVSALERSPGDVLSDYVKASEFYRELDWGDRTQMASRKKFCRMVFRIYATAGMPLSGDEILKFKIKDDDRRLLEAFFPLGEREAPAVDIGFIMLFAFGIVRPWGGENVRWRDISDAETVRQLERLRELIRILRDDMPRLGSTEKPIVFNEWLNIADSWQEDEESFARVSPLRLLVPLVDIILTCRALNIAEQRRSRSADICSIDMPGIWIDDADGGRTRFWIFPDNYLWAFCYRRSGMEWELIPYEFVVRFSEDPEYTDSFNIMSPDGNLRYILSPEIPLNRDDLIDGSLEREYEESGRLTAVVFYDNPGGYPSWCDWRRWERLDPAGSLYKEFQAVIESIYDPGNPQSLLFTNRAPELIDLTNNLMGSDRKYLYVYDRQARHFRMREYKPEHFIYDADSYEGIDGRALFELEISEEHPLYLVPLQRPKERYADPALESFASLLDDIANITDVHIIHPKNNAAPRLFFPAYVISVELDMERLAPLGIRKFTSSPF